MGNQKSKCYLINIEHLKQKLQEEEDRPEFSQLPFHYLETAYLLLEYAPDDIEISDQIRVCLSDLRMVRERKMRSGISSLDGQYLQVSFLKIFLMTG